MNMPHDIELIQNMAKIILEYSPDNARKIIFTSESEPYGVYSLRHEYESENGILEEFYYNDPKCGHYLAEYLSQHKVFFMNKGFGEWKHFQMKIDLDTGKVSTDLKYE